MCKCNPNNKSFLNQTMGQNPFFDKRANAVVLFVWFMITKHDTGLLSFAQFSMCIFPRISSSSDVAIIFLIIFLDSFEWYSLICLLSLLRLIDSTPPNLPEHPGVFEIVRDSALKDNSDPPLSLTAHRSVFFIKVHNVHLAGIARFIAVMVRLKCRPGKLGCVCYKWKYISHCAHMFTM